VRILLAHFDQSDGATLERAAAGPGVDIVVHRSGEVIAPQVSAEPHALVVYCPGTPSGCGPEDLPGTRIVVRLGVGFDNIDVAGWAARGVPVANVPDYGTSEVADHALALMLALRRGTSLYAERLRRDPVREWDWSGAPLMGRLRGSTLGIVGMGRIGIATAARARGFGMEIAFHDPYVPSGLEIALGARRLPNLEELVAASDVVSLHVPLTAETRGLIGAAALSHMRPSAILMNTARGPVVDLDAVCDALRSGRLGGAALDVLPDEPPDPDHPLLRAWAAREPWLEGRLVLTPHAAFYSPQSLRDLRNKAIETATEFMRSGRVRNRVG
jgi:lactate dehydrogenase-like 2-hydroxyacid dehydrogenase